MTAQSNGYIRQLRYRIKKTELGLCFWAGCREHTGGGLCKKHLAFQAIYNRRSYKKRRVEIG